MDGLLSLENINTVDSIKIDVTPSGSAVSSHEYVARNVRVFLQKTGKVRTLADNSNFFRIDAYHLVFVLDGSDVDQLSGTTKDSRSIQLDLEDPEGFTVELYPDSSQSKKFTVVGSDLSDQNLFAMTNMVRTDEDSIQCTTKSPVNRTDIEFFVK